MVLNFARRCREIDRQYEFNNNGDLDNGVYHKYVYNTDEDNEEGGDETRKADGLKDQLSEPMLVSERQKPTKGGRASVENSFENEPSLKQMKERQKIAKQIRDGSSIQNEMNRNRRRKDLDIDDEMVKTYETFQSTFAQAIGKLP